MNFSVMSSTSGNDDQALTTSCTKQKNLSSNLKSKFKVDLHVPANLFKEIVKTNVIQNWKKNNFCNKHFHLDFHVSYHNIHFYMFTKYYDISWRNFNFLGLLVWEKSFLPITTSPKIISNQSWNIISGIFVNFSK